ncbi:hypothetical protein TraAM80_10201 [Trypanosoma rangeli]|uniref:Uncharacterized protein n=1 Tax=Trypanosoma rangeli TaxID=5698 RepID=A0A422MQL6_TRYRA|nr:uncharacterized protein TraAM80_10201 [Trypanosoma rangeli]RNE95494.1 hypothetical protein TraAM80_10201 [Trypanosoma rangeli]|eukprot:RNE95494.1 hypothetical protein TraAM80_10201 [Trypanosoma rangeli]
MREALRGWQFTQQQPHRHRKRNKHLTTQKRGNRERTHHSHTVNKAHAYREVLHKNVATALDPVLNQTYPADGAHSHLRTACGARCKFRSGLSIHIQRQHPEKQSNDNRQNGAESSTPMFSRRGTAATVHPNQCYRANAERICRRVPNKDSSKHQSTLWFGHSAGD